MNERIQKWLENHLVRDEYTEFGWQERHRYEFDEHEIKKFAELIIKECIGIVENLPAGYKDYRNQIEDAFRRDCITELKAHFGVNE